MPGSLFDRTSSLEPTPEPDPNRSRVVRFAPEEDEEDSQGESDSGHSTAVLDENGAGPSTPRPLNVPSHRATQTSVVSDISDDDEVFATPASGRVRRSSPNSDSSVEEATPKPRGKTIAKSPLCRIIVSASPSSHAPSGKGKEPAIEDENVVEQHVAQPDHNRSISNSSLESSFASNMRGKERELNTAKLKQEERARQTIVDEQERARDKERIKALEVELQHLREEVCLCDFLPFLVWIFDCS
jgi:hypothetical protein